MSDVWMHFVVAATQREIAEQLNKPKPQEEEREMEGEGKGEQGGCELGPPTVRDALDTCGT